MTTIVESDLFSTDAKIICHQVNCQGVMGSGVALQVKKKYPHVFKRYVDYCKNNEKLLGTVLEVSTNPNYSDECGNLGDDSQTLCNLFSQDKYGYDGNCYTSYDALQGCLNHIHAMTYRKNNHFGATIAMPYLMGCHRGGGDWNKVYKMIEDTFVDCNVILYKRGE